MILIGESVLWHGRRWDKIFKCYKREGPYKARVIRYDESTDVCDLMIDHPGFNVLYHLNIPFWSYSPDSIEPNYYWSYISEKFNNRFSRIAKMRKIS